jgi:hypothetical protein
MRSHWGRVEIAYEHAPLALLLAEKTEHANDQKNACRSSHAEKQRVYYCRTCHWFGRQGKKTTEEETGYRRCALAITVKAVPFGAMRTLDIPVSPHLSLKRSPLANLSTNIFLCATLPISFRSDCFTFSSFFYSFAFLKKIMEVAAPAWKKPQLVALGVL